MKKYKFQIVLLLLCVGSLNAQWTKSVALNTGYDDNAFRNFERLSDYATQISGYLAKDFTGDKWNTRLFYRGSYNAFVEYKNRNYHFHQMGAAWSRKLGESGNTLNIGANGKLRKNRDDYDYYNLKEGAGFANFKFNLGVSGSGYLGYKLRSRSYDSLSELSYTEHYGFARYSHFFETRTSLMLEANYGRKTYRDQVIESGMPQTGNGHYGSGNHRGGQGHFGMGNSNNATTQESEQPELSQIVLQLRLAQSLGVSTGLSFDTKLRRNPGDGVRYLAGQVSGYTTEDELFDDRYGYESEEASLTLTRLLPWQMTLKLGAELLWKDYVNRQALDLSGEVLSSGDLRNDCQTIAWFSLSKSLTAFSGKSVNLNFEFNWTDNQSNDQYYNYQVSLISFGISAGL